MNIDYKLLVKQAVAVERAIETASRKDKELLSGLAELLAAIQIGEVTL